MDAIFYSLRSSDGWPLARPSLFFFLGLAIGAFAGELARWSNRRWQRWLRLQVERATVETEPPDPPR